MDERSSKGRLPVSCGSRAVAKLKATQKKLTEFESGEIYAKLISPILYWHSQFEKAQEAIRQAEYRKEKKMQRWVSVFEQAVDDTYDDVQQKNAELLDVRTECDELRAENAELRKKLEETENALRILLGKQKLDHTNSHSLLSQDPIGAAKKPKSHKWTSREESTRARGAQPNHAPQPRLQLKPVRPPVIHDSGPKKAQRNRDWYATDEYAEKLLIEVRFQVDVIPHLHRAHA